MARATEKQQPPAPVAAPAGDEDPGLRDLLAQRDREYARAAEAQRARDRTEAAERERRALDQGDAPASGATVTSDDPGMAKLLADRDQQYATHQQAQQARDTAARNQQGVGAVYRTTQFPEPSAPLAAPTVADAAGAPPETQATTRQRAKARRGGSR
jgi:hypothetical protein